MAHLTDQNALELRAGIWRLVLEHRERVREITEHTSEAERDALYDENDARYRDALAQLFEQYMDSAQA